VTTQDRMSIEQVLSVICIRDSRRSLDLHFPLIHHFANGYTLKSNLRLDVDVTPIICTTSRMLGDEPPEFGRDLDIITEEPMGLPYQIWLDTGKPDPPQA